MTFLIKTVSALCKLILGFDLVYRTQWLRTQQGVFIICSTWFTFREIFLDRGHLCCYWECSNRWWRIDPVYFFELMVTAYICEFCCFLFLPLVYRTKNRSFITISLRICIGLLYKLMCYNHTWRACYAGLCSVYYFAINNFIENFLAFFTHYRNVGLLSALKYLLDQWLSSMDIAIV